MLDRSLETALLETKSPKGTKCPMGYESVPLESCPAEISEWMRLLPATRPAKPLPSPFDYESHFRSAIEALHAEKRYRVFADLEPQSTPGVPDGPQRPKRSAQAER